MAVGHAAGRETCMPGNPKDRSRKSKLRKNVSLLKIEIYISGSPVIMAVIGLAAYTVHAQGV